GRAAAAPQALRPASSIRAARVSRVKGLQRFAALVALLCGACSRGAAPDAGRTAASRPSILLVTLDTTRADVVAPEGSAELTPNLARLARQATRFSQAYATAPMTLPSHTSMLTG